MATRKSVRTEEETQTELLDALKHVAEEKNIPLQALVTSIEGALASAYKKAYGGTGDVRVEADFSTNNFRVFAQKRVVQTALNTNTEIAWREAQARQSGINLGDSIETEVTPSGFGRIAAQTAKQVLLQRLREAERVQVVSEYADKSGQMYRGIVRRNDRGNIIMEIGKAEAILPRREQVQGENYRTGEALYIYVVEVRPQFRGPSITVSRTHPGLVRQLFMLEVPEIADGIVDLKGVAREAGQRTKIAVAASNPDVDPVGACVGPRGNRVGKVVAELGNEKVDIVRWNADPIVYITNALSPAQISKVILTEEKGTDENKGTATVIVSEDQQSLAIGKQGQNVRLAAKLTGWKIDIRTEKQFAEEQAKKMFDLYANDDFDPVPAVTVRETPDEHAHLFAVDDDNASTQETGETAGSPETANSSETADSPETVEAVDVGSSAPPGDVAPLSEGALGEGVLNDAAPDALTGAGVVPDGASAETLDGDTNNANSVSA
jgi:transcription termination/antitermination protein NusA